MRFVLVESDTENGDDVAEDKMVDDSTHQSVDEDLKSCETLENQ